MLEGPVSGDLYHFGQDYRNYLTIARLDKSGAQRWVAVVEEFPAERAQVIDPTETYIYVLEYTSTNAGFYRVNAATGSADARWFNNTFIHSSIYRHEILIDGSGQNLFFTTTDTNSNHKLCRYNIPENTCRCLVSSTMGSYNLYES